MELFNFFNFLKKKPFVVEKKEPPKGKEFVHRNNGLKPIRIVKIEKAIMRNVAKEKAAAIIPYVEEIAEDEALMSLVNHYGHIGDVFFMHCKKMAELAYQHDILDYYLDQSVQRTNLIYYLFRHRAKDIQLEIWERMVKDKRFHQSVYHFFEYARKEPEYWKKLVVFFQEKKFTLVPCSISLERLVVIEKELFQY